MKTKSKIYWLFLPIFFGCFVVYLFFIKNDIDAIIKAIQPKMIFWMFVSLFLLVLILIFMLINILQKNKNHDAMIAALEDNANKLAQSEREIAWREMAKQVAHEIKNPLTPLKLGIQMLNRSWSDKDVNFDEKFQKFSNSFLEQIDSLSRIASEFSDFAKLPELKLEELNLLEVLNKATELYSQISNVQIITDDLILQNFKIIADKDQLLRSFNNLLKNAIESIKTGEKGIIYISGIKVKEDIEITIKDNGIGIPDHLKERIFSPNFTTKSSGTGLGLAFVKQAIKNMGGEIYFSTNINSGTTFHIVLPSIG